MGVRPGEKRCSRPEVRVVKGGMSVGDDPTRQLFERKVLDEVVTGYEGVPDEGRKPEQDGRNRDHPGCEHRVAAAPSLRRVDPGGGSWSALDVAPSSRHRPHGSGRACPNK